MLKKRKLANGKVRVTFSMPALEGVGQLYVVGEFNEWSETATPMTKADDGSWSVALTLDANRDYQYRYLADGHIWLNDWDADSYTRNNFGSDNSVLNLIEEEKPKRKKREAAKKKL
ncbi:MAG: isoamylase early set domain-containing protein [Chloroflexi bacterium]|nr:isoamylase early set domain-containing protein [Chloroflexota bacterium]